MNTQRPLPMIVAAVLMVLSSLPNLAFPLLPIPEDGPPPFIIYLGVVLGVAGIVAAVGLWMLKKWSIWLTIIVSVLNILSAAPGLVFAPTPELFVSSIVGIAVYVVIIVLVLLPASRRAYTGRT